MAGNQIQKISLPFYFYKHPHTTFSGIVFPPANFFSDIIFLFSDDIAVLHVHTHNN